MSVLRHWHAVWPARELRGKPVRFELDGEAWVLFRGRRGPAVLHDRCPHRGLPLSRGQVVDGQLRCAFHGWRWAEDGGGTPLTGADDTPCVRALVAREKQGLIWVREGEAGEPPGQNVAGFRHLSTFRVDMDAPLEVLVDSFAEIEHTGFVHVLGFDPDRWEEVHYDVQTTPERVRVHCSGPQLLHMRVASRLIGVPRGSRYHVQWETTFSPLCTRYDHFWQAGDKAHPEQARAFLHFLPVDAQRSAVVVSSWTSARPFGRLGLNRLVQPLHARFVRLEIERDRDLLSALPADAVDLDRAWLGHGDRALVATRRRLETLYFG